MYNRILSISYFPPTEYFAFLIFGDAVLECHERYQKQSYRNRTTIVSSIGRYDLSVPTIHDSKMSLIKDVRIDYSTPWQRTHWRSIETSYNSSSYFLYYKDFIKPFFEKKTEFLYDYNLQIINAIFKILQINVLVTQTTHFIPYTDEDLRLKIQPKERKKADYPFVNPQSYHQVFDDKFGFIPNVSILDLIFNLGPESIEYLKNSYAKFSTL